ncbi:MAG: DUF4440 domain-containing protein [Candidatus Coprovivens sp.]
MDEFEFMFYELEKSLFKKEYLNDREYLDRIFHDDYMEYGKSGLIYYKKEIVDSLFGSENRNIEIKDLTVKRLSDMYYLIHYISIEGEAFETLRTSIWVDTGDECKLLFHQGTIKNNN